jgi:hypothetical protein
MDLSKDGREAPVITRKPDPKVVDLWIRRSLSKHYAAVLQEPLPEAWLTLLKSPADK